MSLGWRYAFGLVIPFSALTLLLSVLGLSPAPVMVVAGVVEIQFFIAWAQRRQARHLTPLLALEVIESPREHTAALAVGILNVNVQRSLVDNPALPPELIRQIDLDRANFASNERLQDVMATTTATPEQIAEAVRINVDARLRALERHADAAAAALTGVAIRRAGVHWPPVLDLKMKN